MVCVDHKFTSHPLVLPLLISTVFLRDKYLINIQTQISKQTKTQKKKKSAKKEEEDGKLFSNGEEIDKDSEK